MSRPAPRLVEALARLGPRWLPFADVATRELPLSRLLRLSLFQVSVGITLALLAGTLNRVMIVELRVSAAVVAGMLAIPLLLAPLRPYLGFRSDIYRSALGWRRVPFIWFGAMLQFGGLAIMPFGLLLLEDAGDGSRLVGTLGSALAFLLVGLGAHVVQTTGLALATDLASRRQRPRVVALLYLALLVGMVAGAVAFGLLLSSFSYKTLIQVIQGAAVVTIGLSGIALWKQEPRGGAGDPEPATRAGFREAWARFRGRGRSGRLLIAVGLGAAGFSMQDVLLEPYGGEVMRLGVGATSLLTALMALGAIGAFAVAARTLSRGLHPARLAGMGALLGTFAFAAVILAWPLGSLFLLRAGTAGIGFAGGLFTVGTLVAAMDLHSADQSGLVIGAWGAVQATCAGLAIGVGGLARDWISQLAASGRLGPALTDAAAGYVVVYHFEIMVLFLALVAIGPLASFAPGSSGSGGSERRFGLAEMPG